MLDLEGDLELSSEIGTIAIVARGSEIAVELGGGGAGAILALRSVATSRRMLRAVAKTFVSRGLHLTVNRGKVNVLRLGGNVETDLIGKALGIANLAVFRTYRRS